MKTATPDIDRMSWRFTWVCLAIVFCGLASSTVIALVVDVFGVFGTGLIPPDIVNDRQSRPKLFLEATPAPQAIILGSSRVWKINPDCVTELTGLPTFNFGIALGQVEDWDAVLKFIADRGRAPLRELLIGIEVDAFDEFSSHQLELSSYLRDYSDHPGLSWSAATKALFGQQAFQHGLRSLWAYFRPQDRAPRNYIEPNGFYVELDKEEPIRKGTYSFEKATAIQAQKFKRRASDRFDALNPARVKRFQELVRSAHAAGVTIDVFVPPQSPVVTAARAFSQIPQRSADLDYLLEQLEQAGSLRYHRFKEFEDLGNDPSAFFDGVHLTETTSTHVLLRIFHREHGCGL